MGTAHVHPQSINNNVVQSLKTERSPVTSHSDSFNDQQSNSYLKDPIFIPSFTIRESPFKVKPERQQLSGNRSSRQEHKDSLNPQISQESHQLSSKLAVRTVLWSYVLYDNKLFFRILDFLPCEDCLNISQANHRINSQFYFYKLFHKPNNWNFTMQSIQKRIQHEDKGYERKTANQSIYEESQHSLDIDRLESLFLSEQDVNEQLVRVDRIMRYIHRSGQEYFQGLNSIIVVSISYFQDRIAFYLILLLIKRTEAIHTNNCVYEDFASQVDRLVKQNSAKIYNKIQQFDLTIQYFAMKWIMDLFSSDLSRNVIIYFWDLLLNFGLSALKWFIVSIFSVLQDILLQITSADQLNKKLKLQLKTLVKGKLALKILRKTRRLMVQEVYGSGCSDMLKPWNGFQQYKLNLQNICTSTQKLQVCIVFQTINQLEIEHERYQQQSKLIEQQKSKQQNKQLEQIEHPQNGQQLIIQPINVSQQNINRALFTQNKDIDEKNNQKVEEMNNIYQIQKTPNASKQFIN